MHPTRAATLLAITGIILILAALGIRGASLVNAAGNSSPIGAAAPGPLPELGDYHPLNGGGTRITFRQGLPADPSAVSFWYSTSVNGGPLTRAESYTEDLSPFEVRDGKAYLPVSGQSDLVVGSPNSETIQVAAVSPDHKALAFSSRPEGGKSRLYILRASTTLEWLGEEDAITGLDWSPDSSRLVFTATRDGVDQVFMADTTGQVYTQITTSPEQKSSPRWSLDGRYIAFLATRGPVDRPAPAATPGPAAPSIFTTRAPTPDPPGPGRASADVFVMNADGSNQHAMTSTPQQEFDLFWIESGAGNELAYAVQQPANPQTAYLYAANPANGTTRRVYPPVAFTALECPRELPYNSTRRLKITIENSGLVPLDLQISLRAGTAPFSVSGEPSSGVTRVETITFLAGETRQLEWPVQPAAGRVTHFSVTSGSAAAYPLTEFHCAAPNTYLGLPRLPFLPLTLPMLVIGLLCCIPRLLQLKSALLWLVWVNAPVIYALLVMLEMRMS